MRARPMRTNDARGGGVNVTPMIDVIMVLIVFYLLVGKLAGDRRVAMPLPQSAASTEPDPDDALIVNVLPEPGPPAYSVGGATLAIDRVVTLAGASRAVEIRAPRDAPWASVGALLEACKRAGVRVRLATEAAP